jgi:glutaredoxin
MAWLSQKGIVYVAKDVATDMDARDELLALGSRSTPTITIDGQPFIGFSPELAAAPRRLGVARAALDDR